MIRRRLLATLAVFVLAVLLGPRVMRPVGKRLPMTERPGDYGLTHETVEFAPPDRPITLRAWWLPAPDARAALVFGHKSYLHQPREYVERVTTFFDGALADPVAPAA